MPVEHEVVRPAQAMLAAFVDHGLDLAGLEIDALDRAAAIIIRLPARHDHIARRDPKRGYGNDIIQMPAPREPV
jgi:hypothetical protein